MGIVGLITNAGIHTTLACVLKSFGTPLNTDVANDLSNHRTWGKIGGSVSVIEHLKCA